MWKWTKTAESETDKGILTERKAVIERETENQERGQGETETEAQTVGTETPGRWNTVKSFAISISLQV